jgi:DNA-directed RNA polymerase specialized sigma24 family protein
MSDVTGRRANADFSTFFEAEYERLFQAMYLMCGNKSDAEDLAQEAMARAFERWEPGPGCPVPHRLRLPDRLQPAPKLASAR